MAEEPKTCFLYNNQGTSDKVYFVYLRPATTSCAPLRQAGLKQWEVYAEWGRRGRALKGMVKAHCGGWYRANTEFQILVQSKKDRGYTEDAPINRWEIHTGGEEYVE